MFNYYYLYLYNSIKKNYKWDETNIACSYMMALTQKKIYVNRVFKTPFKIFFLQFFFSFFFFYKWEIVFQRTYYCKCIQKHFGNLTRTASITMTYCQTYNFHNWATLQICLWKDETWKASYCINIWEGKLSSFGWSRFALFFSPNSILLPPKFKIKDGMCI